MTARRPIAGVALVACLALLGAAGGASAAAKPVLTVVVKGSGTVTGVPGGISCPKACRAQLKAGTAVKLTAKAAAGWTFAGWSGACKGKAATCRVRLTASARALATFVRAAQPAGFTPAVIAGTWDGTWKNQTFGSSGPAKFVVQQPSASSFTFTATLGGNVFGCAAPPPTSGEITQGTGPNHWNADGFTIQTKGGGGGAVSVAYDFKANSFTGSGTSGCDPGITWTIKGSFDGNTFTGTVSISLPGGTSATSILSLTRG